MLKCRSCARFAAALSPSPHAHVQVGIIPVLISLLGSAVKEMAADSTSNCIPGGSARLTELQLVCTALTRISEADDMAYQIRQCNGVTLVGKLLLAQPTASAGGGRGEVWDHRGRLEYSNASVGGGRWDTLE